MTDLKATVQKAEQGEATDAEIGEILTSVRDVFQQVDQLADNALEENV